MQADNSPRWVEVLGVTGERLGSYCVSGQWLRVVRADGKEKLIRASHGEGDEGLARIALSEHFL